ncbi:hypothetical protein BJX96DRAFT_125034 [Aspergillus floccosus]
MSESYIAKQYPRRTPALCAGILRGWAHPSVRLYRSTSRSIRKALAITMVLLINICLGSWRVCKNPHASPNPATATTGQGLILILAPDSAPSEWKLQIFIRIINRDLL